MLARRASHRMANRRDKSQPLLCAQTGFVTKPCPNCAPNSIHARRSPIQYGYLAQRRRSYWATELDRYPFPRQTLNASNLRKIPTAVARRLIRRAIERVKATSARSILPACGAHPENGPLEQGHDRVQFPGWRFSDRLNGFASRQRDLTSTKGTVSHCAWKVPDRWNSLTARLVLRCRC